MAAVSVTLSANAGVSLEFGGHTLWVDALHEGKVPGFSTLDKGLQDQILRGALGVPEQIIYTHCHPDHYSQRLTMLSAERFPGAQVLCPWEREGEEFSETTDDLTLTFRQLPHEGLQDVRHYGILICCQGKNILLPGDCAIASPELEQWICGRQIHLAILDFPWMTLQRGREFVKAVLRPEHMLLYHLPFAADDCNGYRLSARRFGAECGILDAPFQRLTVEL